MKYLVTSDKPRVIDGLGVVPANVETAFTHSQVQWFQTFRGVSFIDGLPEGVEIVVDMTGGEN